MKEMLISPKEKSNHASFNKDKYILIPKTKLFNKLKEIYVSMSDNEMYSTIQNTILSHRNEILSLFLSENSRNQKYKDFVLMPYYSNYGLISLEVFVYLLGLKYLSESLFYAADNKTSAILQLLVNEYEKSSTEEDSKEFAVGEYTGSNGRTVTRILSIFNFIDKLSDSDFPSMRANILLNLLKQEGEFMTYISGLFNSKLIYDIPGSFVNLIKNGFNYTYPHLFYNFQMNNFFYRLEFTYRPEFFSKNEIINNGSVIMLLYSQNTNSELNIHPILAKKRLSGQFEQITMQDFKLYNPEEDRLKLINEMLNHYIIFVQGNRSYLSALIGKEE